MDSNCPVRKHQLRVGRTVNERKEAISMDENNTAPKQSAPTFNRGTPFGDMPPNKKTLFVLKVMLCVVSFGFIFPNVMSS